MLRASNLVPKSARKFSPIKQLRRNSIKFNKAGLSGAHRLVKDNSI